MARSICTIEGCEHVVNGRGLCYRHYERIRDAKDPMPEGFAPPWKPCSIEGCDRFARSRGLCSKHYALWSYSTTGEERTCRVCGKTFLFKKAGRSYKGLYCSLKCANQATKNGRQRRGEVHPNWKGGKHIRKRDGYVQLRVDDGHGGRQYVLEHRLVMEQHLGRNLFDYETVHHKNGDKADNRIENLEVRVGRHGKGATEAHCPTCTCFHHD